MAKKASLSVSKLRRRLGNASYRSIAEEFDVSVNVVRAERNRLGIAAWQAVNWTPDKIAILGTMPDKVVAAQLGVTNSSVFSKRVSLGIAPFGKSNEETQFNWKPSHLKRLGTVPDSVLAKEFGISESVVISKRHALGIDPSGGATRRRREWTKKELAMLGKKPDTVVSALTGRGRRHVRAKRESLGIGPFQQQKTIKWTNAIIKKMGKLTNRELAAELGVSEGTVALHRRRLLGSRKSQNSK